MDDNGNTIYPCNDGIRGLMVPNRNRFGSRIDGVNSFCSLSGPTRSGKTNFLNGNSNVNRVCVRLRLLFFFLTSCRRCHLFLFVLLLLLLFRKSCATIMGKNCRPPAHNESVFKNKIDRVPWARVFVELSRFYHNSFTFICACTLYTQSPFVKGTYFHYYETQKKNNEIVLLE